MAAGEHRSSVPQWMGFIGVLLVLMSLYGFVRMVHIKVRQVPYPIRGVYPPTFLMPGISTYSTRESECNPYPQAYYDFDKDGKQIARVATVEERDIQEQLTLRCIDGFDEDRSKQQQSDKNQAAFLGFVGLGLVVARRFVDRNLV